MYILLLFFIYFFYIIVITYSRSFDFFLGNKIFKSGFILFHLSNIILLLACKIRYLILFIKENFQGVLIFFFKLLTKIIILSSY